MAGAASNPQMGGVLDPTRDVQFTGGVTLSAPLVTFTAAAVTATGATGSAATMLSAVTPCIVTVTGTSGAGIQLPTGAAVPGALYVVRNNTTGAVNLYAVGGSINGTTGTTASAISATGNLGGIVFCVTAGAWFTVGPT